MVTFLSKDSDNKGWSWNSNPALFDYTTQAFIHYSVHLCVCVCVCIHIWVCIYPYILNGRYIYIF